MIKVGPNLISKELENVRKILRANDEYLKQNEYLGKQGKVSGRDSEEPVIFDLEDSDDESKREKPWHEIVKKVERN